MKRASSRPATVKKFGIPSSLRFTSAASLRGSMTFMLVSCCSEKDFHRLARATETAPHQVAALLGVRGRACGGRQQLRREAHQLAAMDREDERAGCAVAEVVVATRGVVHLVVAVRKRPALQVEELA